MTLAIPSSTYQGAYLRMRSIYRFGHRLALTALLSINAVSAQEPVRGSRPIPLQPRSLNGNTTITLSVSPSSLSIPLCYPCLSTATTPLTVSATVDNPASTTVDIYAYFGSSTAALVGSTSGAAIASSYILGWAPSGITPTYEPFTETDTLGTAGAGLHVLSATTTSNSTFSSALWVQINMPSTLRLPADTYTGVLYLQAQAF